MRQAVAIVITSLCTVSASCGGGGPPAPFDRVAGIEPAAPSAPGVDVAPRPAAGDVHVPWAIALLSDRPRPAATRRPQPTIVITAPAAAEIGALATDDDGEDDAVHVVLAEEEETPLGDVRPVPATPAAPKVCSSTLNRRS